MLVRSLFASQPGGSQKRGWQKMVTFEGSLNQETFLAPQFVKMLLIPSVMMTNL